METRFVQNLVYPETEEVRADERLMSRGLLTLHGPPQGPLDRTECSTSESVQRGPRPDQKRRWHHYPREELL